MKEKNKIDEIKELKEKINAVILAHNYQLPQIQDAADFTGDSLELSRKAAETEADVILFCGVDFMAETAKILSPEKIVLNPAAGATCPMADMITACQLQEFRKEHPGAPVVSYVNTSAAVKAGSDICCTSSNAVKIVNSLKEEEVIFVPDKNLAAYVRSRTDKKIISWEGYCIVHHSISASEVRRTREANPGAPLMAHPECPPRVLRLADYIVSTSGMFRVPAEDGSKKFIVATEEGIIYPLKKKFPGIEFIPAADSIICRNMKKTTLDKIIYSMQNLKGRVSVGAPVINKARRALDRMLKTV